MGGEDRNRNRDQDPEGPHPVRNGLLTDLEEFLIPAFEFVLQDCQEHLRPTYKHKDSKYVFPNGSEIKLIGLDKKPNGIRSTIDEAGFVLSFSIAGRGKASNAPRKSNEKFRKI